VSKGVKNAVLAILIFGAVAMQWAFKPAPEERREEVERRMNLRLDTEWTKPGVIVAKKEEDGTFRQYHSLRVVDHDGLDKVQLVNSDGVLVWEKFLGDSPPANENLIVKPELAQHACDLNIYVPKLPEGTYSIVVFDKKGNSFTKEAFFGDK